MQKKKKKSFVAKYCYYLTLSFWVCLEFSGNRVNLLTKSKTQGISRA